MKKALFFLLLPAFACAQRTVVTDSTYITNSGGTFFTVRYTAYDNGEIETASKLIGDTLSLYNGYLDAVRQQVNTLANDMRIVSTYPGRIGELVRQANEASAIVGMSILDTLQVEAQEGYLTGQWSISSGATTQPVTFSVNVNEKLRYSIAGGTARLCNPVGDLIRLSNFPAAGESTDFVRLPNGTLVDITRKYKLTKQ
jgi:hypothetical protein